MSSLLKTLVSVSDFGGYIHPAKNYCVADFGRHTCSLLKTTVNVVQLWWTWSVCLKLLLILSNFGGHGQPA